MSKREQRTPKRVSFPAKMLAESEKGIKLDCEGDVHWFPKSQTNYFPNTETADVPEWLYKEKFPGEPV